jgi:hypothetical protein
VADYKPNIRYELLGDISGHQMDVQLLRPSNWNRACILKRQDECLQVMHSMCISIFP